MGYIQYGLSTGGKNWSIPVVRTAQKPPETLETDCCYTQRVDTDRGNRQLLHTLQAEDTGRCYTHRVTPDKG